MEKLAHYRRATWFVGGRDVLEEQVRRVLRNLPDVAATKFEYRNGVDVQIAARSDQGHSIAIYLTLYEEGSPAATVEKGGERVARTPPPAGMEYLKTGIYMVISGNHVGYLANGHTNDGQITGLLHSFLKSNRVPDPDTQFQLQARADRREIERLVRVGVKSIDLNISAFGVFIDDVNDRARIEGAGPMSELGKAVYDFGKSLGSVFGKDRAPQEIEAASDVQAKIHLGYDGRTANVLVPQLLAEIGLDAADNVDQFKIVTKHGVTITRDNLIIKTTVDVAGDDVALDVDSAFQAIRMAMADWEDTGLFEQ